jgi:hypothetical protein
MSAKAPKTVAIIRELARIKTVAGWTYNDLRDQINEHLSDSETIDLNRTGEKQLSRWMHPDAKAWVEPRGEIVLAMQAVVDRFGGKNSR